MINWTVIFVCVSCFLFGAQSWGATYSYEGYDQIVDKLSRYNDGSVIKRKTYRALHTKAHAGIGMSQTFFQTSSSDGDQNGLEHGGLMLSLGMDVFSARWGIEGSFHNFGQSQGPSTQFRLREYSIKSFYKPQISHNWLMRIGGGISSRFLTVNNFLTNAVTEFRTPSMVLTAGLDTYLSDMVSIGADINFKNSLITETIDNQSVDVSIRLDTHF